ncbi:MAG: SIS domain-containing protein [Clostridiales bacterium]|nr:SIS domain-containing protein [Clostridiales bacterium]
MMKNLEKEIREQPVTLAQVRSTNDAALKALIADIKAYGVDNVYISARGTSDHASIYFQYLLGVYVGVPAALATPSVVTAYNGKLKFKNALVIGVSQSGAAADALEIVRRGNESGAITVAVTNNLDSPLAKEAKHHLYCGVGKETSIAATKTFTAQLLLLGYFAAYWADCKELLDALDKVPAAVGTLLDYQPDKVLEMVKRYRFLDNAVVLGRGYNYPIALEGALKILETNRVRMKGYPISDFHHGPIAQVHENDLSIVIAAKGPVLGDAKTIIEKLHGVGSEVLIISDDEETLALSKYNLRLPDIDVEAPATPDVVSVFTAAVTMQLMACKLTDIRDVDPDASKVLNKVTITK